MMDASWIELQQIADPLIMSIKKKNYREKWKEKHKYHAGCGDSLVTNFSLCFKTGENF